MVVVGGAQESLQGDENVIELTLKRRKGFVKLAMESEADLIPAFGFGEQKIYNLTTSPKGSKLRKFQEWVKKNMSFSPVLFSGRGVFQYSFGLMPHRVPMNIVIGEPIPVTKNENPTQEEIDQTHEIYVEALKDLYEKHNPQYGDENLTLLIN